MYRIWASADLKVVGTNNLGTQALPKPYNYLNRSIILRAFNLSATLVNNVLQKINAFNFFNRRKR